MLSSVIHADAAPIQAGVFTSLPANMATIMHPNVHARGGLPPRALRRVARIHCRASRGKYQHPGVGEDRRPVDVSLRPRVSSSRKG